MSLVPFSQLWRGVRTRGPVEQASSSSNSVFSSRRTCHVSARSRTGVQAAAYEPAAALQLAPAPVSRRSAPVRSSILADLSGSGSGDGEEERGDATGSRDEAPSAFAGSSKVLKINIDLLLWRCRTSRIRARQTLELNERKTLYKAAEDGLRRCLALDPADPRAYVVLGKTLVQQKRYDEARQLYQDGCANTGNTNPYIWSAWGWLEALTGNVERARKLYDAAVVVDGTHACAWHKWGMLEKRQGNFTRARDLWMQGIQRCRRKPQSQNAYLYNALGCMAAQLGRVGEARSWFEEGTRSAEGAASVALWQAWAVLEAKQGDPTVVRYLFRKALGANPRSRYVHLAWALWERRQGNPQHCLALLKRGCELNPTDAALYQAWALVEKQAGRIERARELFEQGLKADPSDLYMWQAYGVMEAEQGNTDRARQLFQEGVWADPRSPSTVYVFHAWGALEWQAGNVQTARELFKAAVRVDPKNETTWASWIAMESELGEIERVDELRIRQAERQWEFVVPAGFTTRPAPGLVDTLARFFTARGFGGADSGSSSTTSGSGMQAGPEAAAAAGAQAADGVDLTVDGGGQLRFKDMERLVESNDLSGLPDFLSPDDDVEASLRPPGATAARRQQQQQQQAGAGLGPGASGDNGSGSGGAGGGRRQVPSLVPRPKAAPLRSMG